MFSVTVTNSIMIAHSLDGEVFGPAQRLHGATYVVEVTLRRQAVDADGIVADIGRASDLLEEILAPLAYRNLDDLPQFAGLNTTTEVLAKTLHRAYAAGIRDGRLAGDTMIAIESLKVCLREKPDAWATYDGPVHG